MDVHCLQLLEFETILSELSNLCLSTAGSNLLLREKFIKEETAHSKLLAEVSALRGLIEGDRLPRAADLPAVGDVLSLVSKEGGTITPEAASRVGRFLSTVLVFYQVLEQQCREDLSLSNLMWRLSSVLKSKALIITIFQIVNRDGVVREQELPALASISRRIHQLENDVVVQARHYLTSSKYQAVVNGDQVTERHGRTVIPVKASHQAKIRGVVHEVSASGVTVFIEPDDIIRTGHLIAGAKFAYERELRRIMRKLTDKIRRNQQEVKTAVNAVAYFDTRHARARYAIEHDCTRLTTCSKAIDLRDVRHPLLGVKAIPLSIRWNTGRRVLVISGPNTGGKTVAIKSVGLMALMNQFGMEVPVKSGSSLPLFDEVLCDIGDEQSITQSLSTFSGHVRQLANVLSRSTEHSLVLLDELGSGTDPDEGGALALAVMNKLIARGPWLIICTHHSILKDYAYMNSAVDNAAMEYDLESLEPTYRLLMGIPGDSHALEIARRHGIGEKVIAKALDYLKERRGDTGVQVSSLLARERELFVASNQLDQRREELEQQIKSADMREKGVFKKEQEIYSHQSSELSNFLHDCRRQLEGAIRELREQSRNDGMSKATISNARGIIDKIMTRLSATEDAAEAVDKAISIGAEAWSLVNSDTDLAPGVRVRIAAGGQQGIVIRAGRHRTWEVEIGSVRSTFRTEELELISGSSSDAKKDPAVKPKIEFNYSGSKVIIDLDVHGLRLDDALHRVQKHLDNALLSGLKSCTIIHGIGEGVLRNGIRQLLKGHKDVVSFSDAKLQDGGSGKTVVILA